MEQGSLIGVRGQMCLPLPELRTLRAKYTVSLAKKMLVSPPEQVTQIESELQKYQIPHQIFRYGEAEHGFMCDRRSSYHQESAQDAWEKALELFKTTL